MEIVTEYAIRAYEFLCGRQRNYQLTFGSPAGKAVMADLARFCRANENCWHPDPSKKDVLIGRREVWLRIQHHMRLTPDQLIELYTDINNQPGEK